MTIEYFLEEAEKKGKLPLAFAIISNGKENQEALTLLCLKWYGKMEDKETCYFAISDDIYHEKVAPSLLEGLTAFAKHDVGGYIRKEGRAIETGVGTQSRPVSDIYLDTYENVCDVETVYVNAKERICFDCDLSYETQEEETACNTRTFRAYVAKEAKEQETGEVVPA